MTDSNNISKYTINYFVAKIICNYLAKLNPDFSSIVAILKDDLSINSFAVELNKLVVSDLSSSFSKNLGLVPQQNSNKEQVLIQFKAALITIKAYDSLLQLLPLNTVAKSSLAAFGDLQLAELSLIALFSPDNTNKSVAELINLLELTPNQEQFEGTSNVISILKSNSTNLSATDITNLLETLEIDYKNSLTWLLLLSGKLEEIRVLLLGKNGGLTTAAKALANIEPEIRKLKGSLLNNLKLEINSIIILAKKTTTELQLQQKLLLESVDITLPVYDLKKGGVHPLTRVLEEVVNIFNNLGFKVKEGPEIEDEWYNFSALNFSEFHPAKDSHDTFYCNCADSGQNATGHNNKDSYKKLLRTHTSNVQIRALQEGKFPLQIIAPGKVYRSDDDATHTPMFHQIEGLYVNKTASVAELKYVLTTFCEQFFAIKNVPLRFRPSYFPFTSPSLEVDIGCKLGKNGVIIGAGDDWLEILGCGMVHPNVLTNCGINPKEYQGFAFGMGLERIAMLKYGFPDLREFFSSNYLWLKAYNFNVITTLLQQA